MQLIEERRDEDADASYMAPVDWERYLGDNVERSVDFFRDVFLICHHIPDLFGDLEVTAMLSDEDDILLTDAPVAVFARVPGTKVRISDQGILHEFLPPVAESAFLPPAIATLVSLGERVTQLVGEFNDWLTPEQ